MPNEGESRVAERPVFLRKENINRSRLLHIIDLCESLLNNGVKFPIYIYNIVIYVVQNKNNNLHLEIIVVAKKKN
jgi:hypothetical protein